MQWFDLFVGAEAADMARRLRWDGICVACRYPSPKDARRAEGTLKGALIAEGVLKNSRNALESADLVIVDGREEQTCRDASECWDVDVIVNPEANEERDQIRQRTSGLDHVIASSMAERGIGYCINMANIINSAGSRRAQLLGRIEQNLRIARVYGVRVVYSSGASSPWDVRSPHAVMSVARMLGMSQGEARDAVSKNPLHYVKKASDRSDQDVLMRGLVVKSWGTQRQRPKAKSGWY